MPNGPLDRDRPNSPSSISEWWWTVRVPASKLRQPWGIFTNKSGRGRKVYRFYQLLYYFFLAGLLSACAFVDTIAPRHDTINRGTEEARNKAILLNIVRASHDEPLNFVAFSKVSGTTQMGYTVGVPTFLMGPNPAGAAALPIPGRDVIFGNTTNLSSTGSASNNFDISTFETKDFYNALLRPVDLPTLNYFLRQGYSRELLFWLFTDTIEESVRGKSYGYHYVPGNPEKGCNVILGRRKCFDDLVEIAVATGLTVETKSIEKPKGQQKGGTGVYARLCFDKLLQMRNDLGDTERGIIKLQHLQSLIWSRAHLPACRTNWNPEAKASVNKNNTETDTLIFEQPATPVGPVRYRIVTRSTFGIYQFLGHLLATGTDDDLTLTENTDNNLLTIIRGDGQNCFQAVNYKDGNYCVPETAKNTKQIFQLLAQLVALQTSSQDLAITPTVRVIQ
jgi:hypothetical protein